MRQGGIMTDPAPADEWVTMEEAEQITGLQRTALRQRVARGKLTAKVESVILSYPGKRMYLRRSELEQKRKK
jgi:hypothetical protein